MFPVSALEAKKTSDYVFQGRVESCKNVDGKNAISFSLEKIWKGDAQRKYIYYHQCPHPFFKVGKRYLVYANKQENVAGIIATYGASSCSRTKEIIPNWHRNISNAFLLLQEGWLVEGISSLCNSYDEVKDLGMPKYIRELRGK